jgi:hypothetical protein
LKAGQGKSLLNDGNVFIGKYKNGLMDEGMLFELQSNGTYSSFEV